MLLDPAPARQAAAAPQAARFELLVLCTGNSARSIMAEALFNAHGRWFRAHSAGSRPVGRVNPFALEQLHALGIATDAFHSKSWEEFTARMPLDLVLTVCDNAAAESCPCLPGEPLAVHWSFADPACEGIPAVEQRARFAACCAALDQRVQRLAQMELGSMTRVQVADAMRALAPARTG